ERRIGCFLFQAEDGIRDRNVTGVQTCALPIFLATADVGIAMGARGATAASESADAVITSENFSRLADVVHISRRTVAIALQSMWFGMAVSIGLMSIAAFGYLPATIGALLQEIVDVVAIVIALRALRLYRNLPSTAFREPASTPHPFPTTNAQSTENARNYSRPLLGPRAHP